MYAYIKGTVTSVEVNHIVLENGNIGFMIVTPNPYVFKLGVEYQVYTHHYVREDISDLYGFLKQEEKDLFLKLISVKGIGPKGAMAIIATGSVPNIIAAIESSNSDYLRKFPGIGPKASQQIVLDLKGKFEGEVHTDNKVNDVREVLVSLGYNSREINKVLQKLPFEDLTLDEMIKQALQLMLK